MANHAEHNDHDHDHTEGNRQYYPAGWWIPLVALVVIAIGFAGLGGFLFSLAGSDRWGKHDTEAHAAVHGEANDHDAHLAENKPTENTIDNLTNGTKAFKLLDGVEIMGNAEGIESQLIGFIDDKNKLVDKTTWFTFDRLLFETSKANLNLTDKSTVEQLDNITAILKTYPAVKLKIGGYTDNTGNKEGNMKLSADRANTVMAELVSRGIAADRLAAEGYGDQFPKESNDTEEGRQKNRRIDVRVTAK
jgi:outer membrane protein OmpA-like peptidoglycan-associated protein